MEGKKVQKKILVTLLAAMLITQREVKADCSKMINDGQWHEIKTTGYSINGTMANGEKTYEGAVAYAPELIGCEMVMYNPLTNEVKTYQICDTGGKPIKNGYVADIYFNDVNDAINYGCQKVQVKIIEQERSK